MNSDDSDSRIQKLVGLFLGITPMRKQMAGLLGTFDTSGAGS